VPGKQKLLKLYRNMQRNATANIDVLFPIRCSNGNTGVSGSGKSTLVKKNVSSHMQRNTTQEEKHT
jgi:excinuclease UvrABC ATPase subunit